MLALIPKGMTYMILISACLASICCKYDGGNNTVEEIKNMVSEGKCLAVCPEQLGGLSTPRPCAEIQKRRVVNTEGKDVTQEYIRGAKIALQQAKEKGCTEAILKAFSPSCGCHQIYDGTFSHSKVDGNGIFAQMCIDEGIHCITDQEYREKK